MRFAETSIPGVVVIEPTVHRDARGYFLEAYHSAKFQSAGIDEAFVQDNHSCSVRHTLRGLHMQVRRPQGKLVRVIEGEIWDVAVDVRIGSPTFGQWTAALLSADNFRQLYVPPGCAHGFFVTSERAQVVYKCTSLYDPTDEVGIAYNDPALNISWPTASPLLSERDRRHPTLTEVVKALPPAEAMRPVPTLAQGGIAPARSGLDA